MPGGSATLFAERPMATVGRPRRSAAPPATRFAMPRPSAARPGDDLIAIGADLSPGTLLAGFRNGLFPLPIDPRHRDSKLAWYSPDPRGVLPLDGARVSRSLRRAVRRFDMGVDTDFTAVVRSCAAPTRRGAWITPEFETAYVRLFELGCAHSIEAYDRSGLAGGLFGVRIDGCFVGVSMFHRATDASKVALLHLVDWLPTVGVRLLDVQWPTDHLRSLGAVAVPRSTYLRELAAVTS